MIYTTTCDISLLLKDNYLSPYYIGQKNAKYEPPGKNFYFDKMILTITGGDMLSRVFDYCI